MTISVFSVGTHFANIQDFDVARLSVRSSVRPSVRVRFRVRVRVWFCGLGRTQGQDSRFFFFFFFLQPK